MGIIKTLKQKGSELSKYDGKTPPENKPEKLNRILRFQGSELSRYDGKTPREARYPDPLDSSDSYLSAYKGRTPQPNLLTTDQSPLLYPYSITGEARDQVQFEYGLYSNGATAVLPLPTLLGVDIFATPLSYYYDGTEGYYAETVGIGPNPSGQTLPDGTLKNRLTIAYTAKIANQNLGALETNPFGISNNMPPSLLLEYNSPVSSPEEPSLEFVRIQNPTIRLKDLYTNGEARTAAIYNIPDNASPLPESNQLFISHKEPVWIYNPTYGQNVGASFEYAVEASENGADDDVLFKTLFTDDYKVNLLNRNTTIYNKPLGPPNDLRYFITYTNNDDPSKPNYLTPGRISPSNITWVYNPVQDKLDGRGRPGELRIRNASAAYGKAIGQEAYVEVQAYGGGVNTFPDNFLKLNQNDTRISGFAKELKARESSSNLPANLALRSTTLASLNPIYTKQYFNNEFEQAFDVITLPSPYPDIDVFNRVDNYDTTDYADAVKNSNDNKTVIVRQTNQSFSEDYINSSAIMTSKNARSIETKKYKDLVKFFFEINNNNAATNTDNWFLFFRAYINNFGDNFNSSWQEYKYVGRGENFYKYNGFSREISLDFTIYAHSRTEMKPLYRKLNYLVGTLAPDYSDMGYMRGNFVNLTVGDYIINTPGIIKSIGLKPSLEAGWDINRYATEPIFDGSIIDNTAYNGEYTVNPQTVPEDTGRYIDPNQEDYGGDNYFVGQLPRLIDVTLTFTPIHNFTPEFKANFIRNI
jgi:hypothetical protein